MLMRSCQLRVMLSPVSFKWFQAQSQQNACCREPRHTGLTACASQYKRSFQEYKLAEADGNANLLTCYVSLSTELDKPQPASQLKQIVGTIM